MRRECKGAEEGKGEERVEGEKKEKGGVKAEAACSLPGHPGLK